MPAHLVGCNFGVTMTSATRNQHAPYDVIVLGAGGAGLMCAGVAGQRGRRVVVLDHANKPGKKILISGGGRCNFTNVDTRAASFLSDNPHFAKSALARYTPQAFVNLVESYGVAWHEKKLGQLFCDDSAKDIVNLLLRECDKGGVAVRLATLISGITHSDGIFQVVTDSGTVSAPALVVATGGPSIPKMGATGFAYQVANDFGLDVVTPRPALVPLTLGDDAADFKGLSGVAFDCVATVGKTSFRDAALFTHKGVSGPAILQISSYWHQGTSITLNMVPAQPDEFLVSAKKARPKTRLQTALAGALPHRLAQVLAQHIDAAEDLANISDKRLQEMTRVLQQWSFMPTGSEGFGKAEVTAGGVATAGLSSKTMEAKTVKGLYFIGEAVDVTGWLGGYNFQWAWASGVVAGEAV